MSELIYRWDVAFGTVRVGHVTGVVTDPHGWTRFAYTDTVWLDQDGREVRREPTPNLVRWREE